MARRGVVRLAATRWRGSAHDAGQGGPSDPVLAEDVRQILDERAEAVDRAAWIDMCFSFAAIAAGLESHTFHAVRSDSDGA